MEANHLIERFGLVPHPERGWYRELHRSRQVVVRADGQQRSALTGILFLLEAGAVSRLQRRPMPPWLNHWRWCLAVVGRLPAASGPGAW